MHEACGGGGSLPRTCHAAGTPGGSRFSPCRQGDHHGTLDCRGAAGDVPGTRFELDVLAAVAPGTGPGDLARLLAHDMPAAVRLAAAVSRSCPELTARAAAGDPEPAIRALAMLSPHLDPASRTRLAQDPAVLRAAALITSDDQVPIV